jgi:hypothetical protein
VQAQDVALQAPDAGRVLVGVTGGPHGLAGGEQQFGVGLGQREVAARHRAGEFLR